MIYKINQTPLLVAEVLRCETYAANNTTPSDRLTYQSMRKLRRTGFEGTIPTLDDLHSSLLAGALDAESDPYSKKTDTGLPPALAEVFGSEGDNTVVLDTMIRYIVKLANLILVPVAKGEWGLPPNKLRMDSMLAAEYRIWVFMAFEVDAPFLSLLGDTIMP